MFLDSVENQTWMCQNISNVSEVCNQLLLIIPIIRICCLSIYCLILVSVPENTRFAVNKTVLIRQLKDTASFNVMVH